MKRLSLLFFLIFVFQVSNAQSIVEPPPPPTVPDTTDRIFTMVEQEAEFPGGLKAWQNYISKNLKGDVPVNYGATAGFYRVLIRFVVNKDGRISDVKVQKDPGFGTAQEAVRVIEKGPNWIPARQNGKNVKAYHLQPITFVVAK